VLALDWQLADAVAEALALLEREPELGHELKGRLHGPRSLRVGSYRIIYELAGRGRTVRVLTVRHRSMVYHHDPR
jgi:mRNA interferase RelE/StbE